MCKVVNLFVGRFLFALVLFSLMPSSVFATFNHMDGIRKKKKIVRKTSSSKKVVVPAKLAMTCNASKNTVEIVAHLASPRSLASANQFSKAVSMLVKDGKVTTTNLVSDLMSDPSQPGNVSAIRFLIEVEKPLQYENAWNAYVAVSDSINSKVGVVSSIGCIDLLHSQVASQ